MSEDTRKIEKIEQEGSELSQQDLDKVAGGENPTESITRSEIVVTKPIGVASPKLIP